MAIAQRQIAASLPIAGIVELIENFLLIIIVPSTMGTDTPQQAEIRKPNL
jgi:hypothetical protein